jgi:hypothetical protein
MPTSDIAQIAFSKDPRLADRAIHLTSSNIDDSAEKVWRLSLSIIFRPHIYNP